MNKKGFTLIEALAIIIILAVIAVITIPIIDDTIKKSKLNAARDSAYGLIKTAQQYYYKLEQESDEVVSYSCNFITKCKELQYDGTAPSSGVIRINEVGLISGEVTYSDKYTFCIYKNELFDGTCADTVSADLANELKQAGNHIYNPDGTVDSSKITNCIQYNITVKTGTTLPFCVLDETSTDLILVSKENIVGETQWSGNTSNTYGPNTAMEYLLNQTKDWTNIPVIDGYTYDNTASGTKNYGYSSLNISNGVLTITRTDSTTETIGSSSEKFRARLITYEELIKITRGVPFDWMKDMWTASSATSNSTAYRVLGATVSYPTMISPYEVHDSAKIKAVIQVPKSSL
jgi:type II secretory pathway pseudopilin PulG